MSSPWDGFAQTVLGEFDSGFGEGRAKKHDRETKARQDSQDVIAANERAYGRRRDLGFEHPENQDEAMFRDRMNKKEDLARRKGEADIRNVDSEARLHDRMPMPRADVAEQGIAAKLKATGEGIAQLDDQDSWKVAHPSTWFGGWGKGNLSPEESQLRETLKSNRMRLIGAPVAGSPAPAGGKPKVFTDQQKSAFKAYLAAGKSEAEARALVGG